MENDETKTPLLASASHSFNKTTDDPENDGDVENSIKPTIDRLLPVKRPVTVEPVLLAVAFTLSAGLTLTSQYFYSRVAAAYNYTSYTVATGSDCSSNGSQGSSSLQQEVQKTTTIFTMLYAAMLLLPSCVITILLGSYTDRAGRKYGMVPQLAAAAVRTSLTMTVVSLELPLPYMFLGNLLVGLVGGDHSVIMSCFAYLADITNPQQRSKRLFLGQLSSAIGMAAGGLSVGYMLAYLDFLYTFSFFLILHLVTLLYLLLSLPESIRRDPSVKLLTTKHYRKAMSIYMKVTKPPRRGFLLACLGVVTLQYFATTAAVEITTLYFLNSPFCWGSIAIGFFTTYAYSVIGLGGLALLWILTRHLADLTLVFLAAISGALYFTALGLATSDIMAFIAPVFAIATTLGEPLTRSMATKVVSMDEQGSLAATISPFQQVAALISTAVSNVVYAQTLGLTHGFLYYILAGIMGVVLLLLIYLKINPGPSISTRR